MARQVTISEVAKLAGVHPSTVSRALNPATRSFVNEKTARRVVTAAESLNYFPNIMARSLRTRLSMTIGVIIPDLTNPIFPSIIRGIEGHLAPLGLHERPIISRLNSLSHPVEIKAGMVLLLKLTAHHQMVFRQPESKRKSLLLTMELRS